MKLRHLLESNSVARTNALKKQQELVDAGKENIEVTKLPAGVYQLTAARMKKSWFCTPDGRVEEHELDTTELLTSAPYAYRYAEYVLKGPFPEGEQAIAANTEYALHYALYVLKGPFPAGEPAIASNARSAYLYARDVLKAPFPAGEPVLAADAWDAYRYACDILKAPFPAGEPAIMKSKYKAKYEELLASLN